MLHVERMGQSVAMARLTRLGSQKFVHVKANEEKNLPQGLHGMLGIAHLTKQIL